MQSLTYIRATLDSRVGVFNCPRPRIRVKYCHVVEDMVSIVASVTIIGRPVSSLLDTQHQRAIFL